jgi:hypothetical protein
MQNSYRLILFGASDWPGGDGWLHHSIVETFSTKMIRLSLRYIVFWYSVKFNDLSSAFKPCWQKSSIALRRDQSNIKNDIT